MRLDPIEFAGHDEGRIDGPVLRGRAMTYEERVFAVQSDEADGEFHCVGNQFDTSVIKEPAQSAPAISDVIQGFPDGRLDLDADAFLAELEFEVGYDQF